MKRLLNVVALHFFVCFIFFLSPANLTLANKLFPNDDEYLIGAETMPMPVGGMESIIKKISSMGIIRSTNVQGKVYVLVYVNEQGEVDDVKLVKGIGGGCDDAAIEAIKRTKFSPGENGGKKVKVKMTLSIAFKLN